MADYETIAEDLAAELRPMRVKRWQGLRVRAEGKESPHHDIVCDTCLTEYERDYTCEFSPSCSLTTDVQLREQSAELEQLTDHEQNQWWYLNDIVAWGKVEVGWEPRWYQIGPVRCSAKYKLFRMGRQIGKTEVLAMIALFYAATRSDFRVIVICPYERHIDIIFKRLRRFIQRSDLLSDPSFKVVDRQNPHEIEFYHRDGNSFILGITAGVRTGQKADKARGQSPSLLIVDEADMIDDDSMESILASLRSAGPEGMMVVSSTPTGRRGKFWKWSVKKRESRFKEFHYTSMVAPNWDKEMELFYRDSYSEAGFAHEFLAEFGEEEGGVFQHKYIDASIREYSLMGAQPIPGELYSMGVDWNRKGIGAHVVVVGYDFTTGKYRTAAKYIIDANEFTQHHAINKIIELNDVWKPEYIWCDYGDGPTQIEALQLEGYKRPGTNLYKKVRGIDMGGRTEIRDPISGTKLKKPTKALMVDLVARRLESGELILPSAEDHGGALIGQMREFKVLRHGRDGPVFSDDKEHTLIAWMLAIFAVIMEMSDIAKDVGESRIARVGKVGANQEGLISNHKKRELEERKKRMQPQSRVVRLWPEVLPSRNHVTVEEFLHVMRGGTIGRRAGGFGGVRAGYVGRATWRDGSNKSRSEW